MYSGKQVLEEKITSLIVSFIRSFGNNSHHMGKDAHPFLGKTWVSLPEACGTPLGDQSACRCQLLQWVEPAEKSAMGGEAGHCGDSLRLKPRQRLTVLLSGSMYR